MLNNFDRISPNCEMIRVLVQIWLKCVRFGLILEHVVDRGVDCWSDNSCTGIAEDASSRAGVSGRWPSRPDQRREEVVAAPGDDRVCPSREGSLSAVTGLASEKFRSRPRAAEQTSISDQDDAEQTRRLPINGDAEQEQFVAVSEQARSKHCNAKQRGLDWFIRPNKQQIN